MRYAVEGRLRALFSPRADPRAVPASPLGLRLRADGPARWPPIPLYLLKIEMIPREAAWLPSLVFVVFLAPARLLAGWAYARSGRRDRPATGSSAPRPARHLPVAAFYVLVVFLTQYTSWGGVGSLYEQHAFLLPVPFLSM